MTDQNENPTGPGIKAPKALDLNDTTVKLPRRGGKFDLDFDEARKYDALKAYYKLSDVQMNARIVKEHLRKLR